MALLDSNPLRPKECLECEQSYETRPHVIIVKQNYKM